MTLRDLLDRLCELPASALDAPARIKAQDIRLGDSGYTLVSEEPLQLAANLVAVGYERGVVFVEATPAHVSNEHAVVVIEDAMKPSAGTVH